MGDEGLELSSPVMAISANSNERAAPALPDVSLVRLLELWPSLAEDDRQRLLILAEGFVDQSIEIASAGSGESDRVARARTMTSGTARSAIPTGMD